MRSKKVGKFNVLDDAEDILDDELDIVDDIKLYKGVRLEKEFKRILEDNRINIKNENVLKIKKDRIDSGEGIVYIIKSKNTEKVYIGSTLNDIGRRLDGHKFSYYMYDKYRFGYCSSYDIMKYGDYNIIELERYDMISRKDLLLRESKVIEEYGILCVNIKNPSSGKNLVKDDSMKKRKIDKIEKLYEIGKLELNYSVGMTEEELKELKINILEKINNDLENYRKNQDWYEYWRLGSIDDDIFEEDN